MRDLDLVSRLRELLPGAVVISVGALDDVILDPMRPLHVRTAAARIRPKGSRSQDMMDLQASPETHPALRRALGEELR